MSAKQYGLELTKREGKQKQVNIAQMNEIIGNVSDLIVEDPAFLAFLINNGLKRKWRKK